MGNLFGARYYDARTSVWQSTDPILGSYLDGDGNGGVHKPFNLALYSYSYQNPVKHVDPDGNVPVDTALDVGFIALDIYNLTQDNSTENQVALGLDVLGFVIPYATGLGMAYKAAKAADRALDTAKTIDKGLDTAKTFKKLDNIKNPCSFAAGTQVMTRDGLKNIEDLRAGDYVLAKDEITGKEEWRLVQAVFVEEHNHLLALDIEHDDGSIEKILTTDEHPFFVKGEGWITGINLERGDRLVIAGGKEARVTGYSVINKTALAWNLTVQEYHTYFVGKKGVWVHNGSKPCGLGGGDRIGKDFTKKGKAEIDKANKEKYGGKNICENCGVDVVPGKKHQKGEKPPSNERQRDHITPKSKGGAGDPSNGQILCRDCNIQKSDK